METIPLDNGASSLWLILAAIVSFALAAFFSMPFGLFPRQIKGTVMLGGLGIFLLFIACRLPRSITLEYRALSLNFPFPRPNRHLMQADISQVRIEDWKSTNGNPEFFSVHLLLVDGG